MLENENYIKDAQGRFVPIDSVKPERLLENDLVNDLFGKAESLKKEITSFKTLSFDEVRHFVELLGEKYNVSKGGERGNITLTNFDGTSRVIISVQDFVVFGAELEIAKSLVNECIRKWLDNGVNQEISKLVTHAFRVDKGRVNVRDVLRLKQINIQDETWQKAMSAIDDALRVESSKSYIRFQKRQHQDDVWDTVPLDIAKV